MQKSIKQETTTTKMATYEKQCSLQCTSLIIITHTNHGQDVYFTRPDIIKGTWAFILAHSKLVTGIEFFSFNSKNCFLFLCKSDSVLLMMKDETSTKNGAMRFELKLLVCKLKFFFTGLDYVDDKINILNYSNVRDGDTLL